MQKIILVFHILFAIMMICLILLQRSKTNSSLTGASQSVFGSKGAGSFLFKLTLSFAIVFFVTSLSLNYISLHQFKQEQKIVIKK